MVEGRAFPARPAGDDARRSINNAPLLGSWDT
jgi:hypothetical protein